MGRHSLSDEEKKRKGTFDPRYSEQARVAAKSAKLITGVFLPKVPEPNLPLDAVGRKKFFELAQLLFDQNKLTAITVEQVEIYASFYQSIHMRLAAGKPATSQSLTRMESILKDLKVAENAPTIASPGEKKRFDGVGLRNSRTPPIRLRSSSSD